MKRFFATVVTVVLSAMSLATPAEAVSYKVFQKTLTSFGGSVITLTAKQKAEVKAAVDANPDAEKFICTGIRYESDPPSENIKVRARAKAACAYAKQLNPNLSTWYQSKPTKAKSYAGKVLLTIKSKKLSAQTDEQLTAGESANELAPSGDQTGNAGNAPGNIDRGATSTSASPETLPTTQLPLVSATAYIDGARSDGTSYVGASLQLTFSRPYTASCPTISWFRDGVVISGANSPNYTVTPLDAGHRIYGQGTCRMQGHRDTTVFSQEVAIDQFVAQESSSSPEANLLQLTLTPTPSWTSPSLRAGSIATVQSYTWDAGVSLSYQWLRDGYEIQGATGSSYTLQNADAGLGISVRVTGAKSGYRTEVRHSPFKVINRLITVQPEFTIWGNEAGYTSVGLSLILVDTLNRYGTELSVQWTRNGSPIAGATNATYVVGDEDEGSALVALVTLKGIGFSDTTVPSSPIVVKMRLHSIPEVVISGTPMVGEVLSVDTSAWPDGWSLSYLWLQDNYFVVGRDTSYTLTPADLRKNISLRINASKSGYTSVSAYSDVLRISG